MELGGERLGGRRPAQGQMAQLGHQLRRRTGSNLRRKKIKHQQLSDKRGIHLLPPVPLDLTEDLEQPGHVGQLQAAHRGQQRLDRSETVGCGAAESSTEGEDREALDIGQGEPAHAANLESEVEK